MKKLILSILGYATAIIVLCALAYLSDQNRVVEVSRQTQLFCMADARSAKQDYVGTKFADFNFYESCLLNLTCINTMNDCPTDQIKELSKDWK